MRGRVSWKTSSWVDNGPNTRSNSNLLLSPAGPNTSISWTDGTFTTLSWVVSRRHLQNTRMFPRSSCSLLYSSFRWIVSLWYKFLSSASSLIWLVPWDFIFLRASPACFNTIFMSLTPLDKVFLVLSRSSERDLVASRKVAAVASDTWSLSGVRWGVGIEVLPFGGGGCAVNCSSARRRSHWSLVTLVSSNWLVNSTELSRSSNSFLFSCATSSSTSLIFKVSSSSFICLRSSPLSDPCRTCSAQRSSWIKDR